MISLRKHIDAYTAQTAAAPATPVTAYREILLAIARAGSDATPYLGDSLQTKLAALTKALAETPAPDGMRQIHTEADRELTAWGKSASEYLGEKAKEVREMMIAVANAAASTTERDQRYANRLQELTNQLQSIAKLDDLTSVRRSLAQSTSELKSCTEKMTTENAAAVSQLTAELSAYRAKLEASERRETTDELTSLLNRRGIEARIEEQMASGKAFSLAILDLNEFKKINDVHGHLTGDDLLRQFSAELQTQLRPGGIVGRWGGDEFVVVLEGSLAHARAAMERIRSWVFGSYRLKLADKPDKAIQVNVTAATGIAEWNGSESQSELFGRADESMYADKKSSRQSGPANQKLSPAGSVRLAPVRDSGTDIRL